MDGGDISNLQAIAVLATLAGGYLMLRAAHRRLKKHWRGLFKRRRKPRTGWRKRHPAPRAPGAPFVLMRFWVVDGDTVRDNATKTVYRLENIDCPETEDRAKCFREREQGKRAKFEAIRLLKGAQVITVRPTGKIDDYGRSIAKIDVDGADFGQLMIHRGLARPWRGVREDWCGPNGGLARMAEACSAKLHCKTCGARAGVDEPKPQSASPQSPQTVIFFPSARRERPETPDQSAEAPPSPK